MKVDFRGAWLNLLKMTEVHKPELFTGVGMALLLAATPLAVAATIKAQEKIKEKKEEIAEDIRENSEEPTVPVDVDSIELPAKEVVKASWKYYIPAFIASAAGSYFVISSTKEGLKRTAAAMAMYQLSETAFNNYKVKTREVVGDKKEEEIHNRLMKDRMELLTDDEGHVCNVYDTRDGATLCFDYWSGRYFYSDIDYIRSQINRVNATMLKENMALEAWVSLNDVYNAIGLPDTGTGDSFVWRAGREGIIELRPTSVLVDDRPCWVLNFINAPTYLPPWGKDRL